MAGKGYICSDTRLHTSSYGFTTEQNQHWEGNGHTLTHKRYCKDILQSYNNVMTNIQLDERFREIYRITQK